MSYSKPQLKKKILFQQIVLLDQEKYLKMENMDIYVEWGITNKFQKKLYLTEKKIKKF